MCQGSEVRIDQLKFDTQSIQFLFLPSELNSPVASLVSENSAVQYDATVQHDDGALDQIAALEQTGINFI